MQTIKVFNFFFSLFFSEEEECKNVVIGCCKVVLSVLNSVVMKCKFIQIYKGLRDQSDK